MSQRRSRHKPRSWCIRWAVSAEAPAPNADPALTADSSLGADPAAESVLVLVVVVMVVVVLVVVLGLVVVVPALGLVVVVPVLVESAAHEESCPG